MAPKYGLTEKKVAQRKFAQFVRNALNSTQACQYGHEFPGENDASPASNNTTVPMCIRMPTTQPALPPQRQSHGCVNVMQHQVEQHHSQAWTQKNKQPPSRFGTCSPIIIAMRTIATGTLCNTKPDTKPQSIMSMAKTPCACARGL